MTDSIRWPGYMTWSFCCRRQGSAGGIINTTIKVMTKFLVANELYMSAAQCPAIHSLLELGGNSPFGKCTNAYRPVTH